MEKPLVNRVANSGIITFKLEEFFPPQEVKNFDLKDFLFMELILKEKDFRAALKAYDWEDCKGKILLVHCSADAIIPVWAYMLVAAEAAPYVHDVFQGTADDYYRSYFLRQLDQVDIEQYRDQRMVIKGCSDHPVPPAAYLEITKRLQPIAKKIMFGEPCSTVPVYKKPR